MTYNLVCSLQPSLYAGRHTQVVLTEYATYFLCSMEIPDFRKYIISRTPQPCGQLENTDVGTDA